MLTKNYPRPTRKCLEGNHCSLVPFDKSDHARALYAAFDKSGTDWAYLPYGPFAAEADFLNWADRTCLGKDPLFFTVCVGEEKEPVGLISLLNIVPEHGRIEIGHVHFSPLLQRTAASTEANYLLMRYVFDELGYRRLEWKCDNRNERSKRSALRLSYQFEGVFRQHLIRKGGSRDTAWFSVIDTEWQPIKERISAWLQPSNFSADGVAMSSL